MHKPIYSYEKFSSTFFLPLFLSTAISFQSLGQEVISTGGGSFECPAKG